MLAVLLLPLPLSPSPASLWHSSWQCLRWWGASPRCDISNLGAHACLFLYCIYAIYIYIFQGSHTEEKAFRSDVLWARVGLNSGQESKGISGTWNSIYKIQDRQNLHVPRKWQEVPRGSNAGCTGPVVGLWPEHNAPHWGAKWQGSAGPG